MAILFHIVQWFCNNGFVTKPTLSFDYVYYINMMEVFILLSLELHLRISEITAGLEAENEQLKRQLREMQLREMQVSVLHVNTCMQVEI